CRSHRKRPGAQYRAVERHQVRAAMSLRGEVTMRFPWRSWSFTLAVLGGLATLSASAAFAQTDAYPNRPLRIIVGFAPGGSNDIVARLLADKLNKSLGQPAI